jgi:hypothetical protein
MTKEPNWLDPDVALQYKVILYGLSTVAEGEHRWSLPFKPDNLDGKWRAICTCGKVFGPTDKADEKDNLFYEARDHATRAMEAQRNVSG